MLDYAIVDKVDMEKEMTDSKLNLKLLMNGSSDSRNEQMILVAESK